MDYLAFYETFPCPGRIICIWIVRCSKRDVQSSLEEESSRQKLEKKTGIRNCSHQRNCNDQHNLDSGGIKVKGWKIHYKCRTNRNCNGFDVKVKGKQKCIFEATRNSLLKSMVYNNQYVFLVYKTCHDCDLPGVAWLPFVFSFLEPGWRGSPCEGIVREEEAESQQKCAVLLRECGVCHICWHPFHQNTSPDQGQSRWVRHGTVLQKEIRVGYLWTAIPFSIGVIQTTSFYPLKWLWKG